MKKDSRAECLGPPDWLLLGVTVMLIFYGLVMVYSSSFDIGYRNYGDTAYFFKLQLQWLAIGLVAMFITARLPYRHWTKLSIPIMAVALLLLLFVVIFKGGRLLLDRSVSSVELAKPAMVIYIAHWLSSKSGQLGKVPYGLLPFTIMVGVIAGLVAAQPDVSEAMVMVLVAVMMFFLAGADLLQFAVGILGGTAAFVFVITRLPQALDRLTPVLADWLHPLISSNNQVRQGLLALGSGGILGLGLGNGRMKYQWLPAAHTDSIFAIVGEELGLVGCLLLVGLFVLFVLRGMRIFALAPDAFGRLLAAGITCWIGFQAWVNMAVVTGTIPFSGIGLPFISMGGSSLLSSLVGVGIMLSISRACGIAEIRGGVRADLLTANGEIPKRVRIKLPALVKWPHLRNSGLVSRSGTEETTDAESGGPIHDQGLAPQKHDDQRHRPHDRA